MLFLGVNVKVLTIHFATTQNVKTKRTPETSLVIQRNFEIYMKIKSQPVYILLILLLLFSVFTYSLYVGTNAINKINATDFEKTLLIILFIGVMTGAFSRK